MKKEKSVLFICSGNVFRSPTAEYSLKKYLADNGIEGWTVGSAGTVANPENVDPTVARELAALGIDASPHRQRRITREILDDYDVVIGMAQNHLDYLKKEYGYRHGLLFNELATDEATSIPDVDDVVPDFRTNRPAMDVYIASAVHEIHDKIPKLFERAKERYYLFSDFVRGKTTHRNGYPFITLHETDGTIAFMSVDIPSKEDGHILVIPKERYMDISDIPDETLGELIAAIKHIGDALTADHGGYNILLNNGLEAGQYMMHTHFHLIPRRAGDQINMEGWVHTSVGRDEFVRLNEHLRDRIRAVAEG